MAVEKKLQKTDILVKLYTGDNLETGDPIYKNANLNEVAKEIDPEVAMEAVNSLMSLQQHEVYEINQRDISSLEEW
ncbi:MAG TPA: hypothetical protein VFF20_10375 [Pseudogracilibacillus sp.]|nr:hypothetical protein [Pseudogracilibacillus sp.]